MTGDCDVEGCPRVLGEKNAKNKTVTMLQMSVRAVMVIDPDMTRATMRRVRQMPVMTTATTLTTAMVHKSVRAVEHDNVIADCPFKPQTQKCD